MKKDIWLSFAFLSIVFTSCHESLEEKAAREAREFTEKNCPIVVADGIVNDSMTYEKDSRTLHYYYTLSGINDTTAINTKESREKLIEGVKNSTSIRKYKENGFNFAYTYYSTKHVGRALIDIRITRKEYE